MKSCKEISSFSQAPHFNWRDVVAELDHPTFLVVNKKGLRILLQGLNRGLQDMFPVEYIYRPWKNTEGQVSIVSLLVYKGWNNTIPPIRD